MPTLVVVPSRDRIVPPRSAEPLAAAIPGATVLRPPFGHIGMMASAAGAGGGMAADRRVAARAIVTPAPAGWTCERRGF